MAVPETTPSIFPTMEGTVAKELDTTAAIAATALVAILLLPITVIGVAVILIAVKRRSKKPRADDCGNSSNIQLGLSIVFTDNINQEPPTLLELYNSTYSVLPMDTSQAVSVVR